MAATHAVLELQLQASNHKMKDEQCAGRDDEFERKVLELMLGRFTSTNALQMWGRTSHSSEEQLVKVLDQDQCVPRGWDKCLDLKNGTVYYVNSSTGNRNSSYNFSFPRRETAEIDSRRRDYQELDLRLSLSCDSPKHDSTTSATDASMITSLGKRDHDSYSLSESSDFCATSGSSYSSSSSARSSCASSEATGKSNKIRSGKTLKANNDDTQTELGVMMLVGCPTCLMYVMTSRQDTKCPRCKSSVLFNFLPGDSPSKRITTPV